MYHYTNARTAANILKKSKQPAPSYHTTSIDIERQVVHHITTTQRSVTVTLSL